MCITFLLTLQKINNLSGTSNKEWYFQRCKEIKMCLENRAVRKTEQEA
jgi:hypothetical protein